MIFLPIRSDRTPQKASETVKPAANTEDNTLHSTTVNPRSRKYKGRRGLKTPEDNQKKTR